ncbi:MAG: hypothetical protein ABJR05_02220 [Balneola sp.]
MKAIPYKVFKIGYLKLEPAFVGGQASGLHSERGRSERVQTKRKA